MLIGSYRTNKRDRDRPKEARDSLQRILPKKGPGERRGPVALLEQTSGQLQDYEVNVR